MKRSVDADGRGRAVEHGPRAGQKQQFDLSTVTCKQFFEYSKDNIGAHADVARWLLQRRGCAADRRLRQDAENSKKLGEYCGKNPGHSVITAADKVMGGTDDKK